MGIAKVVPLRKLPRNYYFLTNEGGLLASVPPMPDGSFDAAILAAALASRKVSDLKTVRVLRELNDEATAKGMERVAEILTAIRASFYHGISGMSSRQKTVLEGIIRGKANKELASELNITVRTVKFHVSKILEKLGCQDRYEVSRRFRESPLEGLK